MVEETGAATTVYAFCKAAENDEALLETAWAVSRQAIRPPFRIARTAREGEDDTVTDLAR